MLDICSVRSGGSERVRLAALVPLFLLVAGLLLSGCVIQPVEAQLPLEIGAEPAPSLAIAPVSGPPGTTIFVSGAGYDPDSTVYVNLVIVPDEEPVQATVSIATTDAEGRFNATFIYPYDPVWSDPGEVAVVGHSVDSAKEAAAVFLVEPATETPTPTSTPTPTWTPTSVPGQPTATPVPPPPSDVAIVVSSALNVREGPSTAFPVITTVKQGTPLKVLGQNGSGSWLLVRTPSGVEGWVSRAYTDYTRIAPVVPTPHPPAPTPTPRPPTFTEWRGAYFNNLSVSGAPALVRNDVAVNFDWGHGSPGPGVRPDFFSARWDRTMFFPGGNFRFFARSDDGVRVWVDGDLIIDQWHSATGQTYSAVKSLSNGSHSVRVEYYEATQLASVSVWWAAEGAYPEWHGSYYDNPNLAGAPVLVRNDPSINFNWGLSSPAPGIPADGFSVQWTRGQHFDAGTYRFTVETDDGMRVFVDGTLVIDEWREGSVRTVSRDVYIGQGGHNLRVDFFEKSQYAVARLWWERVDTPDPGHFPDWKGEYWSNQSLSGNPELVRNDGSIDFNWGSGSPDWRIPNDHFSARWTRSRDFSDGVYRFYARSDDGVRVWVNGNRIIDEWHDNSGGATYSADVSLDGWEDLKVEYYENLGGAAIKVWWEKIGATATPTHTPTATATGAPSAYADVSPSSGSAGTAVTVSGGGFPTNRRVNVYLGGLARDSASAFETDNVRASTITDQSGRFSAGFTIPAAWPDGSEIKEGRLVVLVATEDFATEASAMFDYQEPPPVVAPQPYAQASPSSGGAGTQVSVSGGGFAGNTRVYAYLAGIAGFGAMEAAESPTSYASTTTDGNGNFAMQFAMPANWPSGAPIEDGKLMILVATDGYGQRASTTFDFFAEEPRPTVNLQPASAAPGAAVTASGSGYPSSTKLNLFLGSVNAQKGGSGSEHVYASTTSDINGNYSMTFIAPSRWPDDTPITQRRLIVTVANGDFSVQNSATLNFTPGPPPAGTPTPTFTPTLPSSGTATPYPNASVSPSSGGGGTQVTVSGSGFPGRSSVGVYLAAFDKSGSPADDAARFGSASTDGQGRYQVTFTMPWYWPDGARIRSGALLVVAATDDWGVQASALFDYAGATGAGGMEPTATATATATNTPEVMDAPPATAEPPEETPEPKPPVDTPAPPTDEPDPTETPEPSQPTSAPPSRRPKATAPADTPEPATDTPEPPEDTPEPPTATPEPATDTPEPATDTPEPPTNTPEPPADEPAPPAKSKPKPPADTPVPPTATPEPPTATPKPPTHTPVPPTPTPTPTDTPLPPPPPELPTPLPAPIVPTAEPPGGGKSPGGGEPPAQDPAPTASPTPTLTLTIVPPDTNPGGKGTIDSGG